MGKSVLALAKREKEIAEIAWGCLQERPDYFRDCQKEYKKGRSKIPTLLEAYTPPDSRFLEEYGISYPIDPKTEFSGWYGNLITLFLIRPHVKDLTLRKYEHELDKASGFLFLNSLEKVVQRDKRIILEVDVTGKRETLLKQFGNLINQYQGYLKNGVSSPGSKGGEVGAAKKRLRAFKLYKQLKSYRKTALKMAKEGFLGKGMTYVNQYPEDAKRDVMRLVQEAKKLINGGYKKLR